MRKIMHMLCISALALMLVGGVKTYAATSDTIPNGVYIGSLDVSGLTGEQAMQKVTEFADSMQSAVFTAQIGSNTETIKGSTLELTWTNQDVIQEATQLGKSGNIVQRYKVKKDLEKSSKTFPYTISINKDALAAFVEDDCTQYNKRAVDMGLSRDEDTGKLTITEGQDGQKLNVDASEAKLTQFITSEWMGGDATIELEVDVDKAQGNRTDLEQVTDRLGVSSTDYSSSSSNRAKNVENGTKFINGTLLYPGEAFSVVDTVTPFDAENGYEPAPSYESGAVVDSYGGGICQVSTTLYLAVIRAELQVDERHPHSMQVKYVKPSMDAAIAEGSKDFRFTNNTDYPIYIEGYADGSEIGFRIYGHETRDENREVTYESETTSETESQVRLVANSEKAIGYLEQTTSGHDGLEAKLWKIVTVDGKETKTEFNTSTYQMTPTTYSVGVKSSDSEGVSKMYTAIDSNSIDKVYSVMDTYS